MENNYSQLKDIELLLVHPFYMDDPEEIFVKDKYSGKYIEIITMGKDDYNKFEPIVFQFIYNFDDSEFLKYSEEEVILINSEGFRVEKKENVELCLSI